MGKLEQFGESRPKIETKIPAEVLKMNQEIMSDAHEAFLESNRLAIEAMQGMGPRKMKEISDQLTECLEEAKEAVRKFTKVREGCFPQGLPSVQFADGYNEEYKKAA
jgi:hypothetical protein